MPFIILFFLFTSTFYVQAQAQFTQSNLPIVIIDTKGEDIQDDPKIKAEMKIIYNGPGKTNHISDEANEYNGFVGIEFRGSTSQTFPKKPYGIETWDADGEDNDVTLLGMPEESDWTLNATYNDKSLMRDGMAYILAGEIMTYAPRVRYVEMVLNNEYQGVYMIIEKIKRDKNRVDIKKMEATDNTGDKLTGGYIIKLDKETGTNSGEGWHSDYKPFEGAWQSVFYQHEYPKNKDITAEQRDYIRQYIRQFENTMFSDIFADPLLGYATYIDVESLIDFIIINELTKNPDAYRLSTFLYKKRDSEGGKLYFGPVWDFNLGFGNVDYCTLSNPEGLVIEDFNEVCSDDYWVVHFWWKKFLSDPVFVQKLKDRWQYLRRTTLDYSGIENKIDSISLMLKDAQVRNFMRWPVLGEYIWPNYFVGQTYEEEIDYLKDWIEGRLGWLDTKWGSPSSVKEWDQNGVVVFPNPGNRDFTARGVGANTRLSLHGITGDVLPITFSFNNNEAVFSLNGYPAGTYILRMITENGPVARLIVKY